MTMPKDYFQDIVPGSDGGDESVPMRPAPSVRPFGDAPKPPPPLGDKGIRNVNIPQRPRMADVAPAGRFSRPPLPPLPPPRARNRTWLWVLTAVCVAALAVLLILFVFRKTTVSVIPQSQTVTFDHSAQFTMYPQASAASGTISYMLQPTDIEDSEVVQSTGSRHVDAKASGSITVVNNYSSSAIKLIKNTRFETPGGLIFRVPADISIPGKSAGAPGKVQVTVVAQASGQQYNIGPQIRLTIPGLKSSPPEYAAVYGVTAASTTGGFSGDQPGVAPSDMDAAVAKMRARMQDKAAAFADAQNTDAEFALPANIVFTDLPATPEAGNTVRLHEAAHVSVAVVPADTFASTVAQTAAANAEAGSVKLVPQKGFSIAVQGAPSWGTDPLTVVLEGRAQIVWIVDTKALAQALAGRNAQAFQTIVSNFPGVESAHARIEPFWENTFPANPADIHISVNAPRTAP